MGEFIRNEGSEYEFHIRIPEGGSTSDTSYKTKSIYFPSNNRTFNLTHDSRFNFYRIVWDKKGKIPTELNQTFTSIDLAGLALASYFQAALARQANG